MKVSAKFSEKNEWFSYREIIQWCLLHLDISLFTGNENENFDYLKMK